MAEAVPPPFWEALSTTREQLARIETKLDLVYTAQNLSGAKQETFDTRLYALEQGRISAQADAAALQSRIQEVAEQLKAYDVSPPQFKIWKASVDAVLAAYGSMTIAVRTKRELRAQDWALLCGCATALGAVLSHIDQLVKLLGS